MPGKKGKRALNEQERQALRDKARDPAHLCTRCGHRRDQHSYDRADDFMCQTCVLETCYYDPYTEIEWRRIFGDIR